MSRLIILASLATATLVLIDGLAITPRVAVDSGQARSRPRRQLGAMCRWLKGAIDWGCDGPSLRGGWGLYQKWVNGVTDCSSFCVSEGRPLGGRCKMDGQNYDHSTWCGQGGTCDCYNDDDEKAKDMTTPPTTTTASTTTTPTTTTAPTTTTPTTTAPPTTTPSTTAPPTTPLTLCIPRFSFTGVFIPGLLTYGGPMLLPNITCQPYPLAPALQEG